MGNEGEVGCTKKMFPIDFKQIILNPVLMVFRVRGMIGEKLVQRFHTPQPMGIGVYR